MRTVETDQTWRMHMLFGVFAGRKAQIFSFVNQRLIFIKCSEVVKFDLCNLWSGVMEWSLGVVPWSGVLEWILEWNEVRFGQIFALLG